MDRDVWVDPVDSDTTVKLLNKVHLFCKAFLATIEGWPLLMGFI